jgi:hypothetical protein
VLRRPVVTMTEPGYGEVAKAGQPNSLPKTDRGFRLVWEQGLGRSSCMPSIGRESI